MARVPKDSRKITDDEAAGEAREPRERRSPETREMMERQDADGGQ